MRAVEQAPLAKVQSWSDLPRNTSLFESIVVFENYLLDDLIRAKHERWRQSEFLYFGQTNFALTVMAYVGDELL